MKKLFLLVSFLLISCSSTTDVKTASKKPKLEYGECKVGGNSLNWAANYCMWLGNSDDYFDRHVQKCIKEHEAELSDAIECEKREYYKLKFCGHFISLGRMQGSKETCVDNKDNDLLWWKKEI